MKLGPRRNYHKGRAAIRHYANLRKPSDGQQPALFTRLLVVVVTLGVPGPVSLSV